MTDSIVGLTLARAFMALCCAAPGVALILGGAHWAWCLGAAASGAIAFFSWQITYKYNSKKKPVKKDAEDNDESSG